MLTKKPPVQQDTTVCLIKSGPSTYPPSVSAGGRQSQSFQGLTGRQEARWERQALSVQIPRTPRTPDLLLSVFPGLT